MKATTKKKAAGFTIVELMVGILSLAIISLAVGAMLIFAWQGWVRENQSVRMQRNAMIAMRIIEKGIRNADLAEVAWDADGMTFVNAGDTDFSTTELTDGALVIIDSLNISTNSGGGIDIAFTLSTASGTDDSVYQATLYPRN